MLSTIVWIAAWFNRPFRIALQVHITNWLANRQSYMCFIMCVGRVLFAHSARSMGASTLANGSFPIRIAFRETFLLIHFKNVLQENPVPR
jgi:hypothetical protein